MSMRIAKALLIGALALGSAGLVGVGVTRGAWGPPDEAISLGAANARGIVSFYQSSPTEPRVKVHEGGRNALGGWDARVTITWPSRYTDQVYEVTGWVVSRAGGATQFYETDRNLALLALQAVDAIADDAGLEDLGAPIRLTGAELERRRAADAKAASAAGVTPGPAYSEADPDGADGTEPDRVRVAVSLGTPFDGDPLVSPPSAEETKAAIGAASSRRHLLTEGWRRIDLATNVALACDIRASFRDADQWAGLRVQPGVGGSLAVCSNAGREWSRLGPGEAGAKWWRLPSGERRLLIEYRNATDPARPGLPRLDYRVRVTPIPE
ncbi:MAG: hypothetical protein ACF8SC_01325 [Phycisphaerales bacterium JB037]